MQFERQPGGLVGPGIDLDHGVSLGRRVAGDIGDGRHRSRPGDDQGDRAGLQRVLQPEWRR